MKIEDIASHFPGIHFFLKASTTHLRCEAYKQIQDKEMPDLWHFVPLLGSLEHLEFIYQRKLATSSFHQSMINFWYGYDVHGWEDVIQYVLISGDINKLKYIISKGACKFLTSTVPIKTIFNDNLNYALESNQSESAKLYLNELMKLDWIFESENVKDELHKHVLNILEEYPNFTLQDFLLQPKMMSRFMTAKRYFVYMNHVIKEHKIDQFKLIYQLIPHVFQYSLDINNIMLKAALKLSNSNGFCEEVFQYLSQEENKNKRGRIHPILECLVSIHSIENKTKIDDFLNTFHDELSRGDITKTMLAHLLTDTILKTCLYHLDFNQARDILSHGDRFVWSSDNLKDIYQNESMENIGKLWEILVYLSGNERENISHMTVMVMENHQTLFFQKFIEGFHHLPTNAKSSIEDELILLCVRQPTRAHSLCIERLLNVQYANQPSLFQKVFLMYFEHLQTSDLQCLLQSNDKYVIDYWKALHDENFSSRLRNIFQSRPQVFIDKIYFLDLPFKNMIHNLPLANIDAYYKQKTNDILKFIKVHKKIQGENFKGVDDNLMKLRLEVKKRQKIISEDEIAILERLNKPYLKYHDHGVSISLARCLTTGLIGYSESSRPGSTPEFRLYSVVQMVLDTFNYNLKKKNGLNIETLLSCKPICGLMHFSFQQNENQIMNTIKDSPDLEWCLNALLDIPEFREKGLKLNFGVQPEPLNGETGVAFTRDFLEYRENAMTSLSSKQTRVLDQLKNHYGARANVTEFNYMDRRTQLKQDLAALYNANPLIVDGNRMPLEYNLFLTQRQKEACFKDPLHSAIRYLSVPNPWLHSRADYVDSQRRCAQLDWERVEAAWLFWLAANDSSPEMLPENHTVEERQNVFYGALATCARGHNIDRTATQLGRPGIGYIDDLDFDRPTCNFGAMQRIFNGLLYHPFVDSGKFIEAKEMLDNFRKDEIYQHVMPQINLDNVLMIFDVLAQDIELSEPIISDLQKLNLPRNSKDEFKAKMRLKFENQTLPWIYDKLIEHMYSQNNTIHVLTCMDELKHYLNDKVRFINRLVEKELQNKLDPDSKIRWERMFESNNFICQSTKPEMLRLQEMSIAKERDELKTVIKTLTEEDDLEEIKRKINVEIRNHQLPDEFFQLVSDYVLMMTTYDDVDALLSDWFKEECRPFNHQEFSLLEQLVAFKVWKEKLDIFSPSTNLAFSMFRSPNPLESLKDKINSNISILNFKIEEQSPICSSTERASCIELVP